MAEELLLWPDNYEQKHQRDRHSRTTRVRVFLISEYHRELKNEESRNTVQTKGWVNSIINDTRVHFLSSEMSHVSAEQKVGFPRAN